jgi:hypothetical protein
VLLLTPLLLLLALRGPVASGGVRRPVLPLLLLLLVMVVGEPWIAQVWSPRQLICLGWTRLQQQSNGAQPR